MIRKLKIVLISLALTAPLTVGVGSALTAKDCASGKVTTVTINNKKQTQCVPLGNNDPADSPIWKDLQAIVNALSAGVGVVVVGTIIVGGIQYTVAGDQAGKVEEAKKRIANGIFALVAFFLTWAFLEWLIPGGVFK